MLWYPVRLAVRVTVLIALVIAATAGDANAQQPTAEQVREILRSQPDLVRQLRQRVAASGLTPDQIRARLRAAGYPETLLDDYLRGADTTRQVQPGSNVFEAIRLLGIATSEELDSLRMVSDTLALDSLPPDSLELDSLARDSLRRRKPPELELFGLEVFRARTTQF
jgi:polysaccharide export outer membrane protein